MTAQTVLDELRTSGFEVTVVKGGQRIAIHPRPPEALARKVLAVKPALLALLAVLAAQQILRQGKWPKTNPSDCGFHIGRACEDCKRCGAPWLEHYPKHMVSDETNEQ
jgi:hypothetical protein